MLLHAVGQGTSHTQSEKEHVAMKRSWILLMVAAALAVAAQAYAFDGPSASSWHGYYYDAAWGMPVALVVPPGVHTQANLSWGVPSSPRTRSTSSSAAPGRARAITTAPPSCPRPLGPATPRSSACITSAGHGSRGYGRLTAVCAAEGDCPNSGTTLRVVATKMGLSPYEVRQLFFHRSLPRLASGPVVFLRVRREQAQFAQGLATAQPANGHQGGQPFLRGRAWPCSQW